MKQKQPLAGESKLRRYSPLRFFTGHVQGITASTSHLFFSSVHTENRSGMIFRLHRHTLELELSRSVEVRQQRFHPGGLSMDGDRLLVPIAEYRGSGVSTIARLCPDTLAFEHSFEVHDHIGAIARVEHVGFVAVNWDAARFYVLEEGSGRILSEIPNPTAIAYQDLEWAGDRLSCSGISRSCRSSGRVDVYAVTRPAEGAVRLSLERCLPVPRLPDGGSLAREGMTLLDGTLMFLPEDYPNSRLYTLEPNAESWQWF